MPTGCMVQVVKFLVEEASGLHFGRVDCKFRNALIRACEKGRLDVAKLLLEKGSQRTTEGPRDDKGRKKRGASALVAAIAGGHLPLVRVDDDFTERDTSCEVGWLTSRVVIVSASGGDAAGQVLL